MFKDKDEELRRLEALLQEEEEDEQLLEEEGLSEDTIFLPQFPEPEEDDIDRAYMEHTQVFSAYNADQTDTDLEEFSDEVWEGNPRPGISPLVVVACIITTGIVLAILYLLLRYGGLL